MAAVTEIDATIRGRRWAIASEAGAAGLKSLSIQVRPGPAMHRAAPGRAADARSVRLAGAAS